MGEGRVAAMIDFVGYLVKNSPEIQVVLFYQFPVCMGGCQLGGFECLRFKPEAGFKF